LPGAKGLQAIDNEARREVAKPRRQQVASVSNTRLTPTQIGVEKSVEQRTELVLGAFY